MNQRFPQSGLELRVHRIASDTTSNLTTLLNVSGQPPCVGIVGVIVAAGTAGVTYLFTATHVYVAAAASLTDLTRSAPMPFMFPMSIKNAAGTSSTSVHLITASSADATVLYLVDTKAAVV